MKLIEKKVEDERKIESIEEVEGIGRNWKNDRNENVEREIIMKGKEKIGLVDMNRRKEDIEKKEVKFI